MHDIVLHRHAVKAYKKADSALKKRISEAFDIISKDPRYHPHIKKLKGVLRNMYRYRLGDLRILYEIEEEGQIVRIKTMEARGSVYKPTAR